LDRTNLGASQARLNVGGDLHVVRHVELRIGAAAQTNAERDIGRVEADPHRAALDHVLHREAGPVGADVQLVLPRGRLADADDVGLEPALHVRLHPGADGRRRLGAGAAWRRAANGEIDVYRRLYRSAYPRGA